MALPYNICAEMFTWNWILVLFSCNITLINSFVGSRAHVRLEHFGDELADWISKLFIATKLGPTCFSVFVLVSIYLILFCLSKFAILCIWLWKCGVFGVFVTSDVNFIKKFCVFGMSCCKYFCFVFLLLKRIVFCAFSVYKILVFITIACGWSENVCSLLQKVVLRKTKIGIMVRPWILPSQPL